MNGVELLDRAEGGESALAAAMLAAVDAQRPEPQRVLAQALRRLSAAR